MRIQAWLGGALALLLAMSPHRAVAQAIQAGDVIVSYADELWRVDPETGSRSRFSPEPLSLVNHIGPDGSDQIAIDPVGAIFLVSDGEVVEIDPAPGDQSILQQRNFACVDVFCGYLTSPLALE